MSEEKNLNSFDDENLELHLTGWRKAWFVFQVVQVRLRFVALLVLTGFVVGYWDHVQAWYDKYTRPQTTQTAAQSDIEYFCPMHTFIVRSEQGKCPICGMPLSQRHKGENAKLPEGVLGRVQSSPERVAQAGVEVVPVSYQMLTRQTRAVGTVDYDEQKLGRLTARFPGRIEKVFVNYVGAEVKKGQPLVTIYSPKYFAATQEFVQSLSLAQKLGAVATPDERKRAQSMADFARQRLLLAGFEPEQLEEIQRTGKATDIITYYAKVSGVVIERKALEGEYVDEGQVLYTVGDLKNVWVQVQIPEGEMGMLREGIPVELTTVARPGEIFFGNVNFITPSMDPNTRSVNVRIEVKNDERKLLPGMYATAVVRSPLGRFEPAGEKDAVTAQTASAGGSVSPSPAAGGEQAKAKDASTSASVYYQCDMHPEVISGKPGDCPKCGMHLTRHEGKPPVEKPAESTSAAKETTTSATGDKYICTMCPDVISDKPGECPKCGMKLVKKPKESPEQAKWAVGYTCSMHPEVLRDKPGICDVCPCKMQTTKWKVERVLAIPEKAVIDTGTRKIVYTEEAPGVFDAREVQLGPRAGEYYPVLSGVKYADRIAAAGAFLIDAENRLNPSPGSLYAPQSSQEEEGQSAHSH